MKLFDSHCHLDDGIFTKDMDAVLDRFKSAGGSGIMIAGIDEASCRKAIGLARMHEMCIASMGVHPHHAAQCSEKTFDTLIEMASDPNVHAWGEIGLDFNRNYSPVADQESCFLRQLEIADALGLPIIFHERDTGGRFLELLKNKTGSSREGVIHCFSGDRKEMDAYLKMGLSIGITGIITMKTRGAALRELVPVIPVDRLLVETDAPWLTPTPQRNRHKRNEPAFVRSTLLKLATVREEDPEELAEQVWENTCRLYKVTWS